MKVKANKNCYYEIRKLKERDRGKQTLDAGVYPVVRFSHKGTPTSMLLKHSLRVSLPGNQVSSVDSTTVTLIPFSTKKLLHKGRGSPRPPYKDVVATPHQVGGSMTCRQAFKAPRCRRNKIFF